MTNNLQALILIGGLGTRLKKVISGVPKPMAPINGKPFLEYLVLYLKKQGIRHFVFCVGYLPKTVKDHFGKGEKIGVEIRYSQDYSKDGKLGGTAWAVLKAKRFIKNSPFLVLNGDTFLEVDIKRLFSFHQKNQAIGTICLTHFEDIIEKGEVLFNKKGRIEKFLEKQPIHRTGWINGGAYLFQKEIFDYFPKIEKKDFVEGIWFSLERHVFPEIIKRKLPLFGFKTKGYFIDIGTPIEYQKAQKYFK